MEFKVAVVLGLIDSLEAADEVLMDFGGEWLRGLDLVVGGGMEIEDLGGSRKDLAIGERSEWGAMKQAIIISHVRLFNWVDLE